MCGSLGHGLRDLKGATLVSTRLLPVFAQEIAEAGVTKYGNFELASVDCGTYVLIAVRGQEVIYTKQIVLNSMTAPLTLRLK